MQTNFEPALATRSKQVKNEWSHKGRWLFGQV